MTPYLFTPDLAEENASMADLGDGGPGVSNGRAQNGGSRIAAGPIPVPQNRSERVRTPTDIMRERRDREARKKRADESRQREEVEAQQRARAESAAAGDAPGEIGTSDRSRQATSSIPSARRVGDENRPQDTGGRRQRDRISAGNVANQPVPPGEQVSISHRVRVEPMTRVRPPDSGDGPPPGRRRSQPQEQSTPVQPPQTSRVTSQPQQSRPRQTSTAAADPSGPASTSRPQNPQGPSGGSQQRGTTTSSFPHAFERWETLSSHWEGLTSFWIRRLQQNSDEIDKNPLNSQLARQVNDLSAAGANLFHAVVELQRLRASSERKFQRWFFETRSDMEQARERQAGLEATLLQERQAKADAVAALTRVETDKNSAYQNRTTAEQMVKEMRRELQISKEEARRAWEELGRREHEERERTISLRNGQPTLVGGVQVVPTEQRVPSGQASTARPSTREGPSYQQGPSVRSGQESIESPTRDDPGYTTYDPARSDTDTDPFTESGRTRTTQAVPTMPNTIPRPQQTSNASVAALQAAQAASYPSSRQPDVGLGQEMPQSSQGGTYLRYGPGATGQLASSFYQHQGSNLLSEGQQARSTEADERSFVPSVEDTSTQEDWEMDSNGQVQHDASGRPIPARRGLGSDDSDEYDVRDQLERERMYGQRYGSGISGVEYGSGSTSSVGEQGQQTDYSGAGYGPAPGWEAVPRHQHPTRLSDVLEEDERTNRTSPSRASQR